MRRFFPTLAGASAVALLLLVAGFGGGGPFATAVLLPLAGAVAWWVSRRGGSSEGGWGGSAPFVFVPAQPHVTGSPPAVAGALTRVESRELLSSGSFGVALGFAALVVVFFGFVFSKDFGGDLPRYLQLLAIFVHPVVGLTVFAAFRGRARGRRDGAEELFGTCPTTEGTRTIGHLGTAWLAATTALLTSALLTAGVVGRSTVVYGQVGAQELAAIAVVAVLGAGGVALGVALARLVPWSLAPIAAVVAIGFLSARLATSGDRATDPVRQLSTWLGDLELDHRLTAPHWGAHLLWLVALTVVVALGALVRDDRRPVALAALGASVAVAAASGWAATRPIDADDAARIASYLVDPLGAQRCTEEGPLRVCTFPGDESLRRRYLDEVAPVVAALPDGVAPMTIRYAADVDRGDLDPEVLALLPGSGPAPEPGLLPHDMRGTEPSYEAARLWVALGATGIAEEIGAGRPEPLHGQARGVLALWLATLGLADDGRRELTSFDPRPNVDAPDHRPWPDGCYTEPAPVRWAVTDVRAARAMTTVPDDEVLAAVHEHWDELLDPGTATGELLALVGLDPVDAEAGETRVVEC